MEHGMSTLLGFDVREEFVELPHIWDEARRKRYLLREDVRKPLSVDTAVWPSLFGDGLPYEQRRSLGIEDANVAAWRGPNQSLWDDFGAMKAALTRLSPRASSIVAVTLGVADPSHSFLDAGPTLVPIQTIPPHGQWRFLGFDIADAGLTSGLSNCGYEPLERVGLQSWTSALNEHHLFTDPQRAWAFRAITDGRVPEHAPFFVLGMWSMSTAES
jgi:hypothetical protein